MEALIHPVRRAHYVVNYNHKDVTASLVPFVLSFSYVDKVKGEADELEITVDDADGRWRGSWYPEKGDALAGKLGWAGERLLPCGDFEIDGSDHSGPPDVVVIRAMAAGITDELRTKRSQGYEQQSLEEVAKKVAARHGFEVVGTIGQLKFERLTQNKETDLGFLKRIAALYGYTFSVRGKRLVFHDLAQLDAGEVLMSVRRRDLKTYSLQDKANAVYRSCTVAYHDPKTGKLVKHTVEAPGVVNGDTLKLDGVRAESRAHAELIGKAAIRNHNGRATSGTLTLDGDPRLLSGNKLQLVDMGRLNGQYLIRQARHTIDRGGGWAVEVEVERVATEVRLHP